MLRRMVAFSCFLLLVLTSCGGGKKAPENALHVFSLMGEDAYLEEGEYPVEIWDDPSLIHLGYGTYVSAVNRKLAISGRAGEGLTATPTTDYGKYFGFSEWRGTDEGIYQGEDLYCSDPCKGLIASENGHVFLIISTDNDGGFLYAWERADENADWESVDLGDKGLLGGRVSFVYYDWTKWKEDPPSDAYIVTKRYLVRVYVKEFLRTGDSSTLEITELETPSFWRYLRPTSMVRIGDVFYIGDTLGVASYDLASGESAYYPIDVHP